jgi:chemotaxis protein MotB
MSGPAKRRQQETPEEHENEERWLLTYADMVTLLMVLFIVMFAISQVDKEKYMALKTGLSGGFGAPVSMISGADKMLERGGHVAPDSMSVVGQASESGEKGTEAPQVEIDPDAVSRLVKSTTDAEVSKEYRKLDKVRKDLVAALRKAGIPRAATFRYDERGLVVSVATDDVLFQNGSADLRVQGRRILDTVAPTLRNVPNKISIDGHTNSIPISTERYPSNWELSADRSTGVLRYLLQHHHLAPEQLSASAFADTKPLRPDTDPRAVVANRRVEIVVIASFDNAAGRSLTELGEEVTEATENKVPATPPTSPTAPDNPGDGSGATAGPGDHRPDGDTTSGHGTGETPAAH